MDRFLPDDHARLAAKLLKDARRYLHAPYFWSRINSREFVPAASYEEYPLGRFTTAIRAESFSDGQLLRTRRRRR